MKEKIRLFGYFLARFGFWNGLKLLSQFNLGRIKNVKLPNIKHSFSLRRRTSDIPTFYQVFINNEYDVALPENVKTIIDGGANIGLFSIKMKNLYPNATIICVEPDPENYQLLKQNVSKYDNVFCENYGIWNADTRLKVYDKFHIGKWGMVVEESITEGTVNAISIDSLLRKYGIDQVDILKLDIETSEKIVFSNNYEQWLSKVKILIIELHDWVEKGCARPFFEAINKTFPSYQYTTHGENTIIRNDALN